MDNFERACRAHTAVSMLESLHRQLEQVYTESAKGTEADILEYLGEARKAVEKAQQKQLRYYDKLLDVLRRSDRRVDKP